MSEKERDYLLFLEDILNAIEKIEIYTKELSFEDFFANSMAADAVIKGIIEKNQVPSLLYSTSMRIYPLHNCRKEKEGRTGRYRRWL